MNTPRPDRADVEMLMNELLPFARKMLQENSEFFPFGGHMRPDGTVIWEGAHDGRENPPSQDLIKLLTEAHRQQADSKAIRACAVLYDIRIIPPGKTQKQDAIAVSLDHENGYSGVVIFPYTFNPQGQLCVETPFAQKGEGAIFGAPNT